MKNRVELLAPAGDMEKLKTALHFGADAVYFAGKKFGLRAFAGNFEDVAEPVKYCHERGKKAYITLNIYPRIDDEKEIIEYIKYLEKVKPDGVIVSDLGVMSLVKKYAPSVELHISTQANTTNLTTAKVYVDMFGASRVVLARELPLKDIETISKTLKKSGAETEVFVHGAMCISYSGRCLLSNYLTGRDSNRGACAQPCRWNYTIKEYSDIENKNITMADEEFPIQEDERGTYILNSKDLCLALYMDEIIKAGVTSFKIEGRMKSPYYLACVVNTYRKVIDGILTKKQTLSSEEIMAELEKSSHRQFTTGFVVDDGKVRQNIETSHQTQTSEFKGTIFGTRQVDGATELLVEMRNRFKVGDVLELLSPTDAHNMKIKIVHMEDEDGEEVVDAKRVQQKLWLRVDCAHPELLQQVRPLDIVRM